MRPWARAGDDAVRAFVRTESVPIGLRGLPGAVALPAVCAAHGGQGDSIRPNMKKVGGARCDMSPTTVLCRVAEKIADRRPRTEVQLWQAVREGEKAVHPRLARRMEVRLRRSRAVVHDFAARRVDVGYGSLVVAAAAHTAEEQLRPALQSRRDPFAIRVSEEHLERRSRLTVARQSFSERESDCLK